MLDNRVSTCKTVSCLLLFPTSSATDNIELGFGDRVVVENAVFDVVLLASIHAGDVKD